MEYEQEHSRQTDNKNVSFSSDTENYWEIFSRIYIIFSVWISSLFRLIENDT